MRIQEPSDAILALSAAEYCARTLDEKRFSQLKEVARAIVWQSVAHAMPVRGTLTSLSDLHGEISEAMVAEVSVEDIPQLSPEEVRLLTEALEHLRAAKESDIEHATSSVGTAHDRLKIPDHEATLRHIDGFLSEANVAA